MTLQFEARMYRGLCTYQIQALKRSRLEVSILSVITQLVTSVDDAPQYTI